MHQSISLLKTAWTVLVRTIKLNPPLVYHVGNSTQVKINDGWMDTKMVFQWNGLVTK